MHDPHESIYKYDPSLAGCIVAIVVFAILTAHQGWIMFRRRCWYWMPFWWGGVFEVIGYIVRIASSKKPGEVGLYAAQTLFILLPPAMFAASIYMTLGRLVLYLDAERLSPIKSRFMTKIFVTGDVLSFLMQGAGGGLQGSSAEYRTTGSWVTIGGLIVQLVFFGCFVFVTFFVHMRLRRGNWSMDYPGRFKWPVLLYALYAASILILIRSIFRVIEFAQGYDGYTMSHEIFMYMFDMMLMVFCMLVFSIVHPSDVMVKNKVRSFEMREEDSDPLKRAY